MTFDQAHFEYIVDEALKLQAEGKAVAAILKLFPDYATELKEVLESAEYVKQGVEEQNAKVAFEKLVNQLPSPAKPQRPISSFFISLFSSMQPLRIASAAVVFFVVIATGGVWRFWHNQQILALATPPPIALPAVGLETRTATPDSFSSLTPDDLGVQYAEPTGLAETDVQRTVGRVIKAATPDQNVREAKQIDEAGVISDTREFIKTDYHAYIRTRQVDELARRIKTLVRGYDGRIDSSEVSHSYGSITFVVPESKFDDFILDIKSLAGKRFLIEEIREENLLTQKQSIEQNTEAASNTVASLQNQRKTVEQTYQKTIRALSTERANIRRNIQRSVEEEKNLVDEAQITENQQSIRQLQAALRTIESRLATENNRYKEQINTIDNAIKDQQAKLAELNTQDKNLLETVATVRGTLSLEWISIPGIISLYTTDWWPWILAGGGLALIILFYRRRSPPASVSI